MALRCIGIQGQVMPIKTHTWTDRKNERKKGSKQPKINSSKEKTMLLCNYSVR